MSVHTIDAVRHNSWIKEGYRIDDREHVVKKITNTHITSTGEEAQKNYGENFPPHFYPNNYEKPNLIQFPEPPMLGGPEGRDLSPRQAEVIHAVLPRRSEPLAPRPQNPIAASEPVNFIPSLPTASISPKLDYPNFVGAKPKVVTKFGNYPELIQGAVINFAPCSISPKLVANVSVQNNERQENFSGRNPQRLKDFYNPGDAEPLGPFGINYAVEEEQPNATMETTVSGQSAQPKRVGRWTLAQLRQTDGIIPSQAGWNKGDSQKLMTNFGTPRNTQLKVKSECLQEIPDEVALRSHGEVRLQSGTNKFDSQRGMTGFGTIRNTSTRIKSENLAEVPEEKIRASDGIVRLQAGTNKYDSQKGMTGFGTARRETTKMIDTKHPEYDHERPDQSEIPLQSGTNKFASQKGMTGFGTNRRETSKIVDTAHPEYDPETSIDATSIPYQMGSNKYASQKGMTGFGQPRWEVLDPSISWQNRKSQGMVRLQSGTNRFASQAGMIGFGTVRNTTYVAEAGELPYEDMKKSEAIIPSQAGWNKGDSQKGYTSFGAPRDVRGKHLKRIWELEYPEEAEVSLDRL